MKRYWIVLILLITLITGCNNSNLNTSDESSSNSNMTTSVATSATSQAIQDKGILETVAEHALDIKSDNKYLDEIGFTIMEEESLGELKYGLEDEEIIEIIGAAENTSDAIIWGADEMEHQTWAYESKGLELDMIRSGECQKVDMITAKYPCVLKTKQNIGIGSSKDEVINAYNDLINQEESSFDQGFIVVGSVYGGILFTLDNSKVSEIYIGVSAD